MLQNVLCNPTVLTRQQFHEYLQTCTDALNSHFTVGLANINDTYFNIDCKIGFTLLKPWKYSTVNLYILQFIYVAKVPIFCWCVTLRIILPHI